MRCSFHADVGFPKDDLAGKKGGGDVDDALVGRATEQEVRVAETLDVGTVHQHVDAGQQLALVVVNQTLVGESRVAPDVLIALAVDGLRQLSKARRLRR